MKKTTTSAFIGYIGGPDFRGGTIQQVTRRAGVVHVRIHGATGQNYDLSFGGVRDVQANQPTGKTLYTISEMRGHAPLRKFVFDAWEEDAQSSLEINAERFAISLPATRAKGRLHPAAPRSR